MTGKADKLPNIVDRLVRDQKSIKELYGYARLGTSPLALATPIISTGQAGGSSPSAENTMQTFHSTMDGPIIFTPKLGIVSNGRVDISFEGADVLASNTFSSNALITGQGTPDDVQFIDGAIGDGQILIFQGTNQQVINLINANLVNGSAVGDGSTTTITVTLSDTGTLADDDTINVVGGTAFDINDAIIDNLVTDTSFTYELDTIGSTTPANVTIQDGNILSNDGTDVVLDGTSSILGVPIVWLKFDTTAPAFGAWRVINDPQGSGGGGSVSFPVDFPEINLGNVSGVVDIDWSLSTRHGIKLTMTGDTTLTFSNTTADTTEYSNIIIVQDGIGDHTLTLPVSTVNASIVEAGILATATEETGIVIKFSFGTFYAFLETGNTVSGGGVSALSQLTIDVNKDWQAQGITNFGSLTGVTGIDMDGSTATIEGLQLIDLFQTDQQIESLSTGIEYTAGNLQSHLFKSQTNSIAQFEEAAASVFRLNMLDHSIRDAKDISFDVAASFSGSSAVPTIGFDASGADFFYNVPNNAKHVWTANSIELMGLTASQLTFADGLKIQGNPNATNPGFSVGSFGGDPATTTDGDIWYNSTANTYRVSVNGVDLDIVTGSATGFATTTLDNLTVPTTINTSLISDTADTDDLGSELIPWRIAHVRQTQFDATSSSPTVSSDTQISRTSGLSMEFNAAGSGGYLWYFAGVNKWNMTSTQFSGDFILLQNSLNFNSSGTDPVGNGELTRNVNSMLLQTPEFDLIHRSTTTNDPINMTLRKFDSGLVAGEETHNLTFNVGATTVKPYAEFTVGALDTGDDASFLQIKALADGLLQNVLNIHGDDTTDQFQISLAVNGNTRIIPESGAIGLFFAPTTLGFTTNVGVQGTLAPPFISDSSPSQSDLNAAFGAFSAVAQLGIDSLTGDIYTKTSAGTWRRIPSEAL